MLLMLVLLDYFRNPGERQSIWNRLGHSSQSLELQKYSYSVNEQRHALSKSHQTLVLDASGA